MLRCIRIRSSLACVLIVDKQEAGAAAAQAPGSRVEGLAQAPGNLTLLPSGSAFLPPQGLSASHCLTDEARLDWGGFAAHQKCKQSRLEAIAHVSRKSDNNNNNQQQQ